MSAVLKSKKPTTDNLSLVKSEFTVMLNVPMPPASMTPSKYPFAKMAVGSMFEFAGDDKTRNRISTISRNYARLYNPGAKFATRKLVDKPGYYGIWRTA